MLQNGQQNQCLIGKGEVSMGLDLRVVDWGPGVHRQARGGGELKTLLMMRAAAAPNSIQPQGTPPPDDLGGA